MGLINLGKNQTIALDTNIFIYASSKLDPRKEEAREVLEYIKETGARVFISVLVLEEFFIHVYKQKRDKDVPFLLDFITLGGLVTVIDLNREISLKTAKLRAQYSSLRAPDAIHLASAIEIGATVFITTDRRIPRKVESLQVIVLQKQTN